MRRTPAPRHVARAAVLFALLVSPSGCPRGREALSDRHDAAPVIAPAPPASSHTSPAPSAASAATTPRDAIGPSSSASPADSSLSGGTWESCYAGYVPEGEPAKDVTRLGLLCGPYHGMRQVRPQDVGRLGPGEEHVRTFHAERGACFRVMTVGDASLGTVEVELVSSDDAVAVRSAPGRWSVLPARGVWCAERDGEVRIRVKAGGAGSYAMQLWLLP